MCQSAILESFSQYPYVKLQVNERDKRHVAYRAAGTNPIAAALQGQYIDRLYSYALKLKL
jgi:hypothetical protein